MHRLFRKIPAGLLCALAILAFSATADAQFRAAVQGTVADASGGVVAGASVTLTSVETGRTQQTTTSEDGFYRFSNLAPGRYTLSVEQANFKKQVTENIDVAAENVQGVDVVLQAGGIAETVTVTDESAPPLETETGNVQKSITTAEVRDLPQQGRDPYELLRLTPGIFGSGARGAGGGATNLPNATGPGGSNTSIFQVENQVPISANGQRVSANNFQIDGVSVNSLQYGGAAVITPNQESVKEILVTGTSFTAEDGRNSGAQVKVVSQNGTNEFHGSLFYKYNDPSLNAFNRFYGIPGRTTSTPQRVENRFRNFGGSIGGPIVKNKLFFFFSYEGLRNNTTNTYNEFIETPEFRQRVIAARPNGVTAQIFQSAGIEPRVVQLLTRTCASVFGGGAAARCREVNGGLDIGSPAGTLGSYLPFGGGIGQVDIGGGFDGVPDIVFATLVNPETRAGNQYNFRFDYNLNATNQIAVSSYITKSSELSANRASRSRPGSDIRNAPLNYVVTGTYISNLSSTMVNEFRANYTRFFFDQVTAAVETNFGIPRVEVEGLPFDRIRFGAERSETTPAIFDQRTLDINNTLTKVFGSQVLKFGGVFRREYDDNDLSGGARPVYSFVGLWNLANDAPIFQGINVDPRNGGFADSQRFFRSDNIAAFVQDDWKVRPNLTLNLGLRYEYFSPLSESGGRLTNLVLGTGARALLDARLVSVDKLSEADKNNFAPRFGFAYSPGFVAENKAVIRGGFGIHYNRVPSVIFSNSRGNPPFFARFNICCGTAAEDFGEPFANFGQGNQIQYYIGSDNSPTSFPRNTVLGGGINANGLPNVGGAEIYGSDGNVPNATVYKYALELQYQLPYNLVASAGYEGNRSRNLIRLINLNFFYDQNPNIAAAFFPRTDVTASYNGLNLRLERRFADGFQIAANYRLSESIDTLSNEGPGAVTNQTYPLDIESERGPSDYDARHYATVSGLWELPIFRNRKNLAGKILGGWELSGILTYHTGFPWTAKLGRDIRGAGGAFFGPIRPIAVIRLPEDQDTSNSSFLRPNGYFPGGGAAYFSTQINTDASGTPTFQLNPPGIGRNTFRGPNYFNVDLSLAKKFSLPGFGVLGENPNLEIRVNAFNVFNRLNLQQFGFFSSGTFVDRANFGEPDGALAGRTIEFQARFRF